jgi:hypothetical protein
MHELPQTSGNLTSAAQNLYELFQTRAIRLYADKELRTHALNAVAIETARGWRLAKEKSSSKIDGLAALSFACLDAIERQPPLAAELAALRRAACPLPCGESLRPSPILREETTNAIQPPQAWTEQRSRGRATTADAPPSPRRRPALGEPRGGPRRRVSSVEETPSLRALDESRSGLNGMSRRAGFLGRLPPRSARGAVRVLAASPPGDTPFAAGLDCGHPGERAHCGG